MVALKGSSPLIVAIEGFDGAGKSTLATSLSRALGLRGMVTQVIGKRLDEADNATDSITRILMQVEGNQLSVDTRTQVHLRLARSFARRALVSSDSDVVLVDRWLLSELAYLSIGSNEGPQIFGKDASGLAADLTLFLNCSFEESWARVRDRGLPLTPKQSLGADWNRMVYDRIQDFATVARSSGGYGISGVADIAFIDATQPAASVLVDALELVGARISSSQRDKVRASG